MRKPSLAVLSVALLLTVALIAFSALRSGPTNVAAAAGIPAGDHFGCGAKGTYGFTGFGTTFAGNPFGYEAGIISTNGTLTLDGNGNWFVSQVEVVNSVVVSPSPSATYAGTYTLNPDCTFAAMVPGFTGPVFVGVVVDRGNQIRAMGTTPGEQINYVSTVRIKTEYGF